MFLAKRDLEIIKLALINQRKTILKMEQEEQVAISMGIQSENFSELATYQDGLIRRIEAQILVENDLPAEEK